MLTNLKTITFHSNIKTIGASIFANCTSFSELIIEAIVPPTTQGNIFVNTHQDLKIYVPDESVAIYKSATNWSLHASRILPLSTKPV